MLFKQSLSFASYLGRKQWWKRCLCLRISQITGFLFLCMEEPMLSNEVTLKRGICTLWIVVYFLEKDGRTPHHLHHVLWRKLCLPVGSAPPSSELHWETCSCERSACMLTICWGLCLGWSKVSYCLNPCPCQCTPSHYRHMNSTLTPSHTHKTTCVVHFPSKSICYATPLFCSSNMVFFFKGGQW